MKSLRQSIITKINNGNIASALADITGFLNSRPDLKKEYEDDTQRLGQRYFYMLRFMLEHGHTAETSTDYEHIVEDCRMMLDQIYRDSEIADGSTLYASQTRYFKMRPEENLQTLIVDYLTESASQQLNTDALLSSGCFTERERIGRDIFKHIWIDFPLSDDNRTAIYEIVSDPTLPMADREMWISAVMLGLLEYYDVRRFELLADIYCQNDSLRIQAAALCGLLLGLFRFRNRRTDIRLTHMLAAIPDRHPQWQSDVRAMFFELIRSRDTERLSRKMREEIMPGMMQMGSKIMDRLNDTDGEPDMESLVENPEWAGIMNSDGILDKMKELNELQMAGGDVFMSAFANMRNFSFFHDIANWFMPFSPEHSSLSAITDSEGATVAELISAMPVLCDSDKYAVLLALASTPEGLRRQAMEQMSQQSHEMLRQIDADYMRNLEGDRNNSFRRAANNYVKNIYRFFRLFRRKNEFFDPFSKGISPIGIHHLSEIYESSDERRLLAEFFFNLSFYSESAELLEDSARRASDAILFQRAAFSFEKAGNLSKAIELYSESLSIAPESAWTLRRQADCQRKRGLTTEAGQTYRRLLKLNPDDMSVLTEYGMVLIENSDYKTAIEVLSQADYQSDSTNIRVRRGLAWAQLMNKNFREAEAIYDSIIKSGYAGWSDRLNYGHLLLATNRFSQAVDIYHSLVDAPKGSAEFADLARKIKDDIDVLAKLGIDSSVVARCTDAVYYRLFTSPFGTL